MNPLPQNGFAPAVEAALERRIDAALERKPAPHITADFAARVAAQAVALPRRRSHALPVGRTIAWISAAALGCALFALAPHTAPSITNLRFDAELVVLLELAGLGWLLSRGLGQRAPH
jgi:hypothetical protein